MVQTAPAAISTGVRGRRVLVVDDDRGLLFSLKSVLVSEGYDVDVSETGLEAVEMMEGRDYSLFILDIALPDISGLELLSRVEGSSPDSVKIMLTGKPDIDAVVESLNQGADHFLLKPVQPEMLLRVVKEKLDEGRVRPFVVACIPAFNEEKCIGGVVVRVREFVDVVLVCDDGSDDLTGAIAEGLGAVVVRHERNLGYGAALQSLFTEARRLGADVIVTLDADGQHDPRDISRLVGLLVEAGDVDIVIGSRFVDGGGSEAPGWRENGIRLITGLVSNDGFSVTDAQSGFRVYSRRALDVLTLVEQGMGVSTEILLKAGERGLRVAEAPIDISYDEHSSTHNPVVHGLDVVLSTVKHLSIRRPLVFYGVPGFVALCVAAVFWGIALRMFAATRTISTNVALVAFSGTVVGLMLMTTAIILWVLISVVREKS